MRRNRDENRVRARTSGDDDTDVFGFLWRRRAGAERSAQARQRELAPVGDRETFASRMALDETARKQLRRHDRRHGHAAVFARAQPQPRNVVEGERG